MYVYRASNFNEELKKYHSLSSRIDNLCLKLETSSLSQAQEKFCWIHSYLKRKEGNFRLIAKLIKVEKETVICLLKIYRRGEPNYRHFLDHVKHQNNLFEEATLTPSIYRWLVEQKNHAPKVSVPTLENELRIWLQRPNWKIASHGITIHESEIWSHKFSQQKIRNQATTYRQIVEELIVHISENKLIGTETNWSSIRFYGKDQFYVLYSDLKIKDQIQGQVLLLIAPIFGTPQDEEINKIIEPLVSNSVNSFKTENNAFTAINSVNSPNWWQNRHNLALDDLITYTKRSYPWYLISDEKFWLRIQDGDGVNLALSTEEKELLHSVSTNKSLPLFLNGRAGSGKSTMLFYLFAYYCYRHLQLCRDKQQNFFAKPHPLFLTYSPSLSDFAKVKVQSILRHHYHFLEESDTLEKIPHLSSFFKSFRCFLLKLLPASERANFAEENHVSFHRFRELLGSRWQNLSPEQCWLVIQNFIKGYELVHKDVYLESTSKYQQIPKKERTVTVAEFEQIRDTVWLWYRKYIQEHSLWDDRDLVRTILDLHCYKPEYTVIFCDEAQDFTRLELQLIMGLSIFSLYNLEQENLVSLPFAFAGDPLQTLNPTGFRWTSFKAAFYDKILTPLGLKSQSQIELKLQQLEYNYRSAAAIVKVNNLIQLWRKILFDFDDIEPQKAKKYSGFIPQKFILGSNISLEDLQKTIKDSIVLIPCDEGAEQEFIAEDDLLSALYSEITTENSWNILSAISAKGLEFKQVILYRFGEACNLKLGESKTTTEEDKYFLNKLYVAASRATEKLFIVDSFEGEIKLWSYASDRQCLEQFLSQIDDELTKHKWQQNIELVTLGTSLSEFNNNVEADALTFETVGINTENINLLARAIAAYRKSQNQRKVDFCLAWKLKLERNFTSAGELFLKHDKIIEAWECFWQAQSWNQLQQLIIRIQNIQTAETSHFLSLSFVIDFMVKALAEKENNTTKLEVKDITELTNCLEAEIKHHNLVEERDTKTWQVFLDTYCYQIKQLLLQSFAIDQKEWNKIAKVLIDYLEDSSTTVKQLIAQCLYFGHNYYQAIQYWEDIDDLTAITSTELKNYYIAKAKIVQLPKGLQYLYQGKQYHLIIKLWLKAGAKLDKAWLQYVGRAFEAIEQYHNALVIYCQLNDLTKVQQCWSKIKHNSPIFTQVKQLIKYYLQHQYWDEAIKLVQQESTPVKLKCYFIYGLAQSNLTSDTLNKVQRQSYQKFVEQNILNSSAWQQYLTVGHTGIALEKIGSFAVTLAFYEQYINSIDRQIQQFARDRWILTKQQQVEYFRSRVKLAKVQRSQQQLTTNAKKWQINPDSVASKPFINYIAKPRLSHNVIVKTKSRNSRLLEPSRVESSSKPSFTITGLPRNSRSKKLAQGIQQIQIYHLLLRLAESSQQLVIFDLLNHKSVHVDWLKGKVQIETTTVTVSQNQPLFLSDAKGQYQATLWRNANPRLELKLNSYPEIITIKFNTW